MQSQDIWVFQLDSSISRLVLAVLGCLKFHKFMNQFVIFVFVFILQKSRYYFVDQCPESYHFSRLSTSIHEYEISFQILRIPFLFSPPFFF